MNEKKSWTIEIRQDKHYINRHLVAIDSETGEYIGYVLKILNCIGHKVGLVICSPILYNKLVKNGYDPHEHGHSFDKDGEIVAETWDDAAEILRKVEK